MAKNILAWKRVLILIAVFVTAVIISALVGTIAVPDSVFFPLSDVRSAVSFADAAVYSLEHCTSSAIQLILLFVSSFSLFSTACAVLVALYRGVSLGFAASLISRGAVMASGGGILSFKSALPVLILYFVCSLLIIIFSAISASSSFSLFELSNRKRRLSLCSGFAVISGTVFLLDIIKVWLI